MRKNIALHHTIWFWVALISPIFFAAALATAMIKNEPSEIELQFTISAINSLILDFKLPIGIMSLSIPFVAVVAAVHRSTQTTLQIAEQQDQNNFINHFKHLEEFKNIFEDTKPRHCDSVEVFHKEIYPYTRGGDFSPRDFDFSPSVTIDNLISRVNLHPSQIFKISRDCYFNAASDPHIKSDHFDTVFLPSDVTELILLRQKAINFSGLHPIRYNIPTKLIKAANDLDALAAAIEALMVNFDSVLIALSTSPTNTGMELTQKELTNRLLDFSGNREMLFPAMVHFWDMHIHTQSYERDCEKYSNQSRNLFHLIEQEQDSTLEVLQEISHRLCVTETDISELIH